MIDSLEEYFKEKEKVIHEMNKVTDVPSNYQNIKEVDAATTFEHKIDKKFNKNSNISESKKIDSSKPNIPWLQYPGTIGCPDTLPSRPNIPENMWNANRNCKIHIVKKGDTLYKIAKDNGIKVIDMLMANPFVDVYNLQIGEELCIPLKYNN